MNNQQTDSHAVSTAVGLSASEQKYLAAITQLLQQQDTVRIIDAANRLGHDRSKTHDWVKKLCDRGIVETVPKKGIITLFRSHEGVSL